jgi:plastocyanin
VTIDFTNPQPLEHDVAIENSAGETIGQTETVAEGSDSTVVELKPGTYHYYCTVPGHREAGMEGTLVVK